MLIDSFLIMFGGLGLFVYGMNLMGEGLERASGDKLKGLLELITENRFMGVLVGTFVTTLIQSSSATTVMVVGLVNAGIIDLPQAIGVIMGANIGTTMTAQLIAFRLTDIALPAIGTGTLIFIFSKNKSMKFIGQVVLGFGLLFFGMKTMEIALKPLAEMPGFINLMINLSKTPILGVLAGFLTTGLVQSSSATIGILQTLADQGVVNLSIALPILFGDNIGTCVTALLSSVGTNITARRAALFHLIFNIMGTVIFMLILPLVETFVLLTTANPVRQIANAHLIFNITNTIIQLPFTDLLGKFVTFIIPGKPKIIEQGPIYIADELLETPSIAYSQVKREIARLGALVLKNLRDSVNMFLYYSEQKSKIIKERGIIINDLAQEVIRFLVMLLQVPSIKSKHNIIDDLVNAVSDIKYTCNNAVNILELAEFRKINRLPFSNKTMQELVEISSEVLETFDLAIYAFLHWDKSAYTNIKKNKGQIDAMVRKLRFNHTERLDKDLCYHDSGVIFFDLLTNLEHIGNYSLNIASYI